MAANSTIVQTKNIDYQKLCQKLPFLAPFVPSKSITDLQDGLRWSYVLYDSHHSGMKSNESMGNVLFRVFPAETRDV